MYETDSISICRETLHLNCCHKAALVCKLVSNLEPIPLRMSPHQIKSTSVYKYNV